MNNLWMCGGFSRRRKKRLYNSIKQCNIIYNMYSEKMMLPNFSYGLFKDHSYDYKKKFNVWRKVIFDELLKSLVEGNTLQFPFIGECYIGKFKVSGNKTFVSAAFEFTDDCLLKKKDHYNFYTNLDFQHELNRMNRQGKFDDLYIVLPIGKYNLEEYEHFEEIRKEEKRRRLENGE